MKWCGSTGLRLANWNYGGVVSGRKHSRLGPYGPRVAGTLGFAFGEFGLRYVIHHGAEVFLSLVSVFGAIKFLTATT